MMEGMNGVTHGLIGAEAPASLACNRVVGWPSALARRIWQRRTVKADGDRRPVSSVPARPP